MKKRLFMLASILVVMLAIISSLSLKTVVFAAEDGSIEISGYIGSSSSDTTYHIIYEANGGIGSYTGPDVAPGETDTILPPDAVGISYDDHYFRGWNIEPDGSGATYEPGDTITLESHIVLYAQWTVAPATSTKESISQATSVSAKTGDESNITLWISMFCLSLASFVFIPLMVRKKREKRSRNS